MCGIVTRPCSIIWQQSILVINGHEFPLFPCNPFKGNLKACGKGGKYSRNIVVVLVGYPLGEKLFLNAHGIVKGVIDCSALAGEAGWEIVRELVWKCLPFRKTWTNKQQYNYTIENVEVLDLYFNNYCNITAVDNEENYPMGSKLIFFLSVLSIELTVNKAGWLYLLNCVCLCWFL